MSIAIGSNPMYYQNPGIVNEKAKADDLEVKINKANATDQELMEACKSFEAYMLEQVFKGMEKTIPKNEEKNPYLDQFGDMLYSEYAKSATENQGYGIAQMLYEAMKRNG